MISTFGEENRSLLQRVEMANEEKEDAQKEQWHLNAQIVRYSGEVERLELLRADLRTELDAANKTNEGMQGEILTLRQKLVEVKEELRLMNNTAELNLDYMLEAEQKLEISENKLNILKERLRAAGLDDKI